MKPVFLPRKLSEQLAFEHFDSRAGNRNLGQISNQLDRLECALIAVKGVVVDFYKNELIDKFYDQGQVKVRNVPRVRFFRH